MAVGRKRRRRSSAADSASFPVEYRSSEDDAWYAVSLRLEEPSHSPRDTVLRVMFCCSTEQWDERFAASRFGGAAELAAFRRRFRRPSPQLQDGDCSRVTQGTLVCASSVVNEVELKFYDALVHSVSHVDHQVVDGEETCRCNFDLSWQHGPNEGSITSASIEHICLLQDDTKDIDPALDIFLGLVTKNLSLAQCRSSDGYNSAIGHESNGYDTKGVCELMHDVDLGGNYLPLVDSRDDYYYIWIENLEKKLLSEDIVSFVHYHTSITVYVLVYPSIPFMSYTRAAIFVDTREKTVKLSNLLCNSRHIIVSASGRPWVVTNKKWFHGLLSCPLQKIEEQPSTRPSVRSDKIVLALKGTKEFEKGMLMHKLFVEFHEHMLRLQKRLVLEERNIIQSNA